MKRLILFLLLAFAISSCVTRKKCLQRYPPQEKVVTKDSIIYKEKIVVRDTTITVRLPGDTVRVDVPIMKAYNPVSLETKYAKATAQIVADRIKLALIQKDAEIQVHIDSAKIEASYWREKYNTDQKTIILKEKYVPGIYKACLWICVGLVVALVGFIALRVLKKKK